MKNYSILSSFIFLFILISFYKKYYRTCGGLIILAIICNFVSFKKNKVTFVKDSGKKNKLKKVKKKIKILNLSNNNDTNEYKKLLAKQKYLQFTLNKKYDKDVININLYNNSKICIVMTGDEKIYSFYIKTIAINLKYANSMKYDFSAYIGKILDKSKYKPHFDRYKILLDLMLNSKYEYLLYIDSDAFIQDEYKKIEDFIDMMKPTDFLLGSEDGGSLDNIKRQLPINSGVLLIKKCPKSIKFCEDVLSKEQSCYMKTCSCGVGSFFYDQCVIERLEEYHKNIKLLPYGILQRFNKNADKSGISFIYHLAGRKEDDRIKIIKNDNIKILTKNKKCSVYILNYNRPHNVYKQIDALINNEYIDEIIVSNGDPDNTVKYTHAKVKIVDDFVNNSKLYAARRWMGILNNCSNEYVLNLDDDLIPSDDLIEKLMYKIQKDPYNIHGPFKRLCTNSGYKIKTKEEYNTIITGLIMTSKKLIQDYMSIYFNYNIEWFKKYKGNCEDLSINMFLLQKGIKPKFIEGKYSELDTSNGYSSKSNHLKVRDDFCKIFSNTYNINDYKNIKDEWNNLIFDKTYIITIPERLDYITYITKIMKINPTIYEGVNKNILNLDKLVDDNILSPSYKKFNNIGRIACYLSHINVLKNFLQNTKNNNCFIFEDDIKLNETLSDKIVHLKKIMNNIPSNWDIIYFGKCAEKCKKKITVNAYTTTNSTPLCLHAYAVSRKGAEIIVKNAFPIEEGVDYMYRKLIKNQKLNEYTSTIPVFFQNRDNFGSSIGHGSDIQICGD
jgi:GR25 family glycosyltransferase involved in LPS biosynthesis